MPSLEAIEQARDFYGLDAKQYPDDLFLTNSSLEEDRRDWEVYDLYGSPLDQARILAEREETIRASARATGLVVLRGAFTR